MDTKMIGNKIVRARKESGLSQAQLAQRLFISPQAVGKWERGESTPDILTINRLAEVLGVDLNFFSESFPSASATTIKESDAPADALVEPLPAVESKMPQWDLSRFSWKDADFSGLSNLREQFSAADVQQCRFNGSDMAGLLLKANLVRSCDFSDANLQGCAMEHCEVADTAFIGCSLKDARIAASELKGCDFSAANLSGAVVRNSVFKKSSLAHAGLNRTAFQASEFSEVVFEGLVEDCNFENCSFFRVIFQNAKLINVFFKCPSLKKIRFADCEADRVTYGFLKNGKADLTGVSLLAEVE